MSACDLNSETMRMFAAAGSTGNRDVTVLLGAGASASSGLPTWDAFAATLLLQTRAVADRELAELMVAHQDPSIVLEAARAAANDWGSALVAALYGDQTAPTPSALHLAAAGHFLADPDHTTLATLNYDLLLEQALSAATLSGVAIRQSNNAPTPEPGVYHLHGVVHPQHTRDAVVGFRDYADLLSEESPWQREFLHDALERGSLLLMGTSYRDPDIRQWLHSLLRDRISTPSALVVLVREAFRGESDQWVTRAQWSGLQTALVSVWKSIGLRALTVDSFADAALMLRELRHVDAADYRSPQDRVRQVTNSHSRRFAALQVDYSNELVRDREEVQRALNTRVSNATLWLARPNGKLARWASHDRTYRSVRDLHEAPIGHDSSWVSGLALGHERTLLEPHDPAMHGANKRWRSVLALPIFTEDGKLPAFAAGVVTYGLEGTPEDYLRDQSVWAPLTDDIASRWGDRLGESTNWSSATKIDRNERE